jgi:hypothetical protein
MADNEDDIAALKQLWPQILAQHDQDLSLCHEWVEGAPDGHILGLWMALMQDPDRIRAMEDESLHVIAQMALVGLCEAIRSVIDSQDRN